MIFSELLERRVRTDGAPPLVTCYHEAGRTELSATTFANWVHKTANLLLGLDAAPGDPVAVRLAGRHPGHWMTLAWHAAAWEAGLVVDLTDDSDAAIEVVGPDLALSDRALDHLACSLHPLALGFDEPLPAGVTDWAADVKAEGDVYAGVPATPDAPAWVDTDRQLTQTDLTGVAPVADRVVVVGTSPWQAVRDALLGPLVGGGSSVVAPPDADLEHLARTERARLP